MRCQKKSWCTVEANWQTRSNARPVCNSRATCYVYVIWTNQRRFDKKTRFLAAIGTRLRTRTPKPEPEKPNLKVSKQSPAVYSGRNRSIISM